MSPSLANSTYPLAARVFAKPPSIDLYQPGRLGVAHMLALFNVSRATFYAGTKTDRYPKPDGHDGSKPFWKTATVREFLDR